MEQFSIFDYMYDTYKINKPVRLIELFSGVGAQAMALKALGVPFEHYRTCEWDINAIASYKAIHCENDNTDYSADLSDTQLIGILTDLGISADGKNPLTREQITRYNSKLRRTIYNNIKATHNLVNITQVGGRDLGITNTDKYAYMLTYSFP